jgi:sortase A
VRDDETIDDGGSTALTRSRGVDLAAFYDRRAAAALAYCARLCPPEAIGDAVETAFARVFEAAAGGQAPDEEALDERLRSAVRAESAARTSGANVGVSARQLLERLADPNRGGACELMPALLAARADGSLSDGDLQRMEAHLRRCPECVTAERRFEEAERAFDALAGDDAPALGRSLLAEMLEDAPATEPPAWLGEIEWETADRRPQTAGAQDEPARQPGETAEWEPEWAEDESEPEPEPAGRGPRAAGRLSPRARKRVAITLLVVGLLLSAEAGATVLWKEPITAFLAARSQADLTDQLEKRSPDELAAEDRARLAEISDEQERTEARMELLAERYDEEVPAGDALGWLEIEDLDAEFVVVQSTDAAALRTGPGHYVETPLPGEGGTVGVAGHRTTYDAPFRSIDELDRGDEITMRMPYGLFTYEVDRRRIVPADFERAFIEAGGSDDGGAGPGSVARGSEWLVLTACHPLYAAQDRILVYAKLVSAEPAGAAVETAEEEEALDHEAIEAAKAERLERLGDRNLGEGMVGDDVKEVQRLLGLPQTGTFGPETTAAVIEFQSTHDLPQVGRVGSQTKAALARRRRPPSRPPTPPAVPPQTTVPEGTATTPDGSYVPPSGETATTPSP